MGWDYHIWSLCVDNRLLFIPYIDILALATLRQKLRPFEHISIDPKMRHVQIAEKALLSFLL